MLLNDETSNLNKKYYIKKRIEYYINWNRIRFEQILSNKEVATLNNYDYNEKAQFVSLTDNEPAFKTIDRF